MAKKSVSKHIAVTYAEENMVAVLGYAEDDLDGVLGCAKRAKADVVKVKKRLKVADKLAAELDDVINSGIMVEGVWQSKASSGQVLRKVGEFLRSCSAY